MPLRKELLFLLLGLILPLTASNTFGGTVNVGAINDDLVANSQQTAFALRGVAHVGEKYLFSIHDKETNRSLWLSEGQSRGALKVLKFNPSDRTVIISWNEQNFTLVLSETSGNPLSVAYVPQKKNQLSDFNKELIRIHEELIKPTISQTTGREVKNQKVTSQLNQFLQANPSPKEVTEFLFPQHEDAVDIDVFLSLEFPEGIPNRHKNNTPGWEIKDELKLEDIQALISTDPTLEQLATIKKDSV